MSPGLGTGNAMVVMLLVQLGVVQLRTVAVTRLLNLPVPQAVG
ncbi:hypothetical protein ACFQ6V_22310 [Streptomyces roseifaciens]